MTSIAFTVTGIPLAWPRAEATAMIIKVNGKLKAVAKLYVPVTDDYAKFKHDVAFQAGQSFQAVLPGELPGSIRCPVEVIMTFVFPSTKGMLKKKKPPPREWMADVPDLDNLEKAILDALNKVVYNDDRQVCKVTKEKVYGAPGEPPCVHVFLKTLPKYREYYCAELVPSANQ